MTFDNISRRMAVERPSNILTTALLVSKQAGLRGGGQIFLHSLNTHSNRLIRIILKSLSTTSVA